MVDYLGIIVRNEECGCNCRLYRLIPRPCPSSVSRAHCSKPSHLANHRHPTQLSLSALITLLGYYASAQGFQQLMLWGMGDFSSVSITELPGFVLLIVIGLLASLLLIKPLNGWMQGEKYAMNLGIDLRKTRLMVLGVTGLLTAVTTAWCGPIAFVGLSMPHVARMLLKTDDHGKLIPITILLGGLCCSLCLWLSTRPDGGTLLPINALTPLFGVPVIVYVLLKK